MKCVICGETATHGIGNQLEALWSFCNEHSEADLPKLTERKRSQVERMVSADFGGEPLRLNGEELDMLLDLLEIFYDKKYETLHDKLLKKKLEIVNKISQNSR